MLSWQEAQSIFCGVREGKRLDLQGSMYDHDHAYRSHVPSR